MEDTDQSENLESEKESPPLKIDPKWYVLLALSLASLTGCSFQDALRAFFQPIKTDDARLDFYTVYKREAMEYDADYQEIRRGSQYHPDIRASLIILSRQLSHSLL